MSRHPVPIDIDQDPAITGVKQQVLLQRKNYDESRILEIINQYKRPLFHWVADKPDSRDYIYKNIRIDTPNIVDLRPWCTEIEDQGNLGSCTGQTVAGAIEYLNKRAGKATDVSRLFIYYYSRQLIGTVSYDSGAYLRDTIKVVAKQGAPLERIWPYNIVRFRTRPSNNAIEDARRRTVTLYERVRNIQGCINALANGLPVSIGFLVYSSFLNQTVSRTGMMPYPNVARESFLGGHAVLLVGYNNNTRRFIARNSWGVGWGDRGYFYMPYGVIENSAMSSDFWVVRTVSNP